MEQRAWYQDWRYWLGGAVALAVIWGVECLRKGGLIWPWPLVPLAVWAVVIILTPAATRPQPTAPPPG